MSGKSITQIARHDRIRREVLTRSDMIPSLPEVVTEVLRLLDEPDSDIHVFEAPLAKDAALVAKMLKLVNSAFFGVGRPVTTIADAVVILGVRSLRSMVLATSTANLLERDFGCYGHDRKGLWQHSLAVAAASRKMAELLKFDKDIREEMFVAGLLHDIGKMLLSPYFAEDDIDVAATGRPACEVEREILGIDHQEAGAIIAENWKLSALVQSVLRSHHEDGSSEEHQSVISMVRLADTCAHNVGYGYRPDARQDRHPASEDLARLGLDAERWAEMGPDIRAAMENAIEALGRLGE